MTVAIDKIIQIIKEINPSHMTLHEPFFGGNEWEYTKECLDTGWVSSAGKYVDLFEDKLAEFTGAKYVVVVVNGTAALHVCLRLVGVQSNDEVLVPALTFVATANAVSYCSAIPHFVDSSHETLGVCPKKLSDYLAEIALTKTDGTCWNRKTKRRIKACIPMHTYGHPVDMDPLIEVCRQYNITIVEDATESLGSFYKGRHTGNFGKISAISFNGNKIITTGGGGAIVTNDESLGKIAKHLTTTAKIPSKWDFVHDSVGYNYRMPNINAALGCAQLEQLPDFLLKKRLLAENYRKAFNGIEGIHFFTEPEFAQSNYWLNVLLLDERTKCDRDLLLERTNNNGIMTRPSWVLMHKLSMYKDCPKMDLTKSENLENKLINIPSSVGIVEKIKNRHK